MVEARGVTKTYGTRGGRRLTALGGVDLALREGETLCLVGESGCGKSTLARLLLKLEKPTSGGVYFRGGDIWEQDRAEEAEFRRSVQMIFQDPYGSLNPRMKAGDIIREPFLIHGLAKRAEAALMAEALLERVGLDGQAAGRYPREFSGGQRQRIGIARALAVSPKVLVADEPVSALDVSIQAQILNLLDEIREERGLTLLFISHDLRVVRAIGQRVMVMYLGRIVEEAPVADFFRKPLHPYSKVLLDSVPLPDPRRRGKALRPTDDRPDPAAIGPGCPFRPRCPSALACCAKLAPLLLGAGAGRSVACHLDR